MQKLLFRETNLNDYIKVKLTEKGIILQLLNKLNENYNKNIDKLY